MSGNHVHRMEVSLTGNHRKKFQTDGHVINLIDDELPFEDREELADETFDDEDDGSDLDFDGFCDVNDSDND